jgi:hypothetical protein
MLRATALVDLLSARDFGRGDDDVRPCPVAGSTGQSAREIQSRSAGASSGRCPPVVEVDGWFWSALQLQLHRWESLSGGPPSKLYCSC